MVNSSTGVGNILPGKISLENLIIKENKVGKKGRHQNDVEAPNGKGWDNLNNKTMTALGYKS